MNDIAERAPESAPAAPIKEIDVLWISAGLSCDGDTIAMTAATQPSVEDLLRGALPWIPKVIRQKNLWVSSGSGSLPSE